jgi:hypothetical protein
MMQLWWRIPSFTVEVMGKRRARLAWWHKVLFGCLHPAESVTPFKFNDSGKVGDKLRHGYLCELCFHEVEVRR